MWRRPSSISQATTQKACALIAEASGRRGAVKSHFRNCSCRDSRFGGAVQAPIKSYEYFKRLAANSIEIRDREADRFVKPHASTASLSRSALASGHRFPVGCLWNSNLLIGSDVTILNHHRKLVPTFYEKLVWANGDGAGSRVNDTPIGRIGMLICGENTNPLARYSLIAQGEQIHISSYPPVSADAPIQRTRAL